MNDEARQRARLGRSLIASARRLNQRKEDFHKWMIAASGKLRERPIELVAEGERVVAVDMALGRFTVAEEFVRQGDQLAARLVFYKPQAISHQPPVAFYSVELHEDGTAYFGHASPETEFDWGHSTDDIWAPDNLLRLVCELAITATDPQPRVASAPPQKLSRQ